MLVNEWCERGEYKTSGMRLEAMLSRHFSILSARQVWPAEPAGFGDWLFLCQCGKQPRSDCELRLELCENFALLEGFPFWYWGNGLADCLGGDIWNASWGCSGPLAQAAHGSDATVSCN